MHNEIIDITKGLDIATLNNPILTKKWRGWIWSESKTFPGFVYSIVGDSIQDTILQGDLNMKAPWILVTKSSDGTDELEYLDSSFTSGDNASLEIKQFLVSSLVSPYYVFFRIKKNIITMFAKKTDKENVIDFNKVLWTQFESNKISKAIVPVTTNDKETLMKYKLAELKEMCKTKGVAVSGTKEALADRLLNVKK